MHQQRLLQFGNGEGADGYDRQQLQQLSAVDAATLARRHQPYFFSGGTALQRPRNFAIFLARLVGRFCFGSFSLFGAFVFSLLVRHCCFNPCSR